jgi:hypothetical protein
MRRLLLLFALLVSCMAMVPSDAPARVRCGSEDSPGWNWARCGNGKRGVVTMWGTPKVVSCGDFHWLATHGDLDPREPWLVGDYSCGRRVGRELNY